MSNKTTPQRCFARPRRRNKCLQRLLTVIPNHLSCMTQTVFLPVICWEALDQDCFRGGGASSSFRMQDYADADVVVLISEIIFRLALKPSSLSWSLLYSLLYSPPLYSINASWFENNMLTWTQTTKYWPWKLVVHVACRARAPTTCWNRSLSLVEHRQLHTAYGAAYSSRLPFS